MVLHILQIILYSLIPGILYLSILYITTPYTSWSFRRSIIYFLGGILTTVMMLSIYKLFPSLSTLFSLFNGSFMFSVFIVAFIQAGLFEELSKYFNYFLLRRFVLKPIKNQHPLATMIYCGAVGLGFSFMENIVYGITAGMDSLLIRSISAVLMHMIAGLIMGYWISLSNMDHLLQTNPTKNVSGISIFDVLMKNKPKFRKVFYIIMGVGMATFFHGLYDFNLMIVNNSRDTVNYGIVTTIMFFLLSFLLYVVKKMGDHLVKLNINK